MSMSEKLKFLKCNKCGNIVESIYDSGAPVFCCGEEMEELVANTVDASAEKHVPSVSVVGNMVNVQVGSILHPMEEQHYIMWIVLQTKKGIQRKNLKPKDEPKAVFVMENNDEVVAVYEYCNLHGLWKTAL